MISAMTTEPRTAFGVKRTDWVGAISVAKATLKSASSGPLLVVASVQRSIINNANRLGYLLWAAEGRFFGGFRKPTAALHLPACMLLAQRRQTPFG